MFAGLPNSQVRTRLSGNCAVRSRHCTLRRLKHEFSTIKHGLTKSLQKFNANYFSRVIFSKINCASAQRFPMNKQQGRIILSEKSKVCFENSFEGNFQKNIFVDGKIILFFPENIKNPKEIWKKNDNHFQKYHVEMKI